MTWDYSTMIAADRRPGRRHDRQEGQDAPHRRAHRRLPAGDPARTPCVGWSTPGSASPTTWDTLEINRIWDPTGRAGDRLASTGRSGAGTCTLSHHPGEPAHLPRAGVSSSEGRPTRELGLPGQLHAVLELRLRHPHRNPRQRSSATGTRARMSGTTSGPAARISPSSSWRSARTCSTRAARRSPRASTTPRSRGTFEHATLAVRHHHRTTPNDIAGDLGVPGPGFRPAGLCA